MPTELIESLPENEVVEVPWLTKSLAVEEGAEHAIHKMAHAGSEAAEEIAHTKVFRNGHRLFKVVDYGYSVYRVFTAPAGERAEVALEEGGRLGAAISDPAPSPRDVSPLG